MSGPLAWSVRTQAALRSVDAFGTSAKLAVEGGDCGQSGGWSAMQGGDRGLHDVGTAAA